MGILSLVLTYKVIKDYWPLKTFLNEIYNCKNQVKQIHLLNRRLKQNNMINSSKKMSRAKDCRISLVNENYFCNLKVSCRKKSKASVTMTANRHSQPWHLDECLQAVKLIYPFCTSSSVAVKSSCWLGSYHFHFTLSFSLLWNIYICCSPFFVSFSVWGHRTNFITKAVWLVVVIVVWI